MINFLGKARPLWLLVLWRRDSSRPIYRFRADQPSHQSHDMRSALPGWEVGTGGGGKPDALKRVATACRYSGDGGQREDSSELDALKQVATTQRVATGRGQHQRNGF